VADAFQNPEPNVSQPAVEVRLESWKEIAAYLKRDTRTVQRWEKREGLPVHRHLHDKLGTVYASKSELDRWWLERGTPPEDEKQEIANEATLPAPASQRSTFLPRAWAASGFVVLAGLILFSWFLLQNTHSRRNAGPLFERATQVDGSSGQVSPDGRWLAYLDAEQDNLMLKNLATGETRLLHPGPVRMPLAWARDSSRLALVVQAGASEAGQYEIRLLRISDGRTQTMWQGILANLVEPQDWIDDRQLMGRVRGPVQSQIVVLTEGSSRPSRLAVVAGELGNIRVSPNGKFIAYSCKRAGNREIYVRNLAAGGAETRITDSRAQDRYAAWSPDGHYLVFVRQRGSTAGLWAARLSPQTGERVEEVFLRTLPGSRNVLLSVAEDGRLFFSQRRRNPRVFLLDVEEQTGIARGPARSPFDDETYDPSWVRAGSLSFLRTLPDSSAVFALRNVEADSQNEYRLPSSYSVAFLAQSNGARQFTFFGSDPDGRHGFFQFLPDTEMVQALHLTNDDIRPPARWSPAGDELLYSSSPLADGRHPVRILNPAAGREFTRVLSSTRPFAKWSPDGASIAFTDANCLKVVPRAAGEPRTILCAEPAVNPKFLSGSVGSLGWAPDGRRIAWVVNNVAERRMEIWMVDADSGHHSVWQGEKDYDSWPRQPSWSPSARQLAFHMNYKPQFEVWSFENVLPKN